MSNSLGQKKMPLWQKWAWFSIVVMALVATVVMWNRSNKPAKPDQVTQATASQPAKPASAAAAATPAASAASAAKAAEQQAQAQPAPAQPAASQPSVAKPAPATETKQPPAEQPKAAPVPAPRKKTAVAKLEPQPAHKAAMGSAGFTKVSHGVEPVYYGSEDQCVSAWRANRAVEYHPTMKHKSYGPERIAGLALRGGEGPACAYMETAIGDRWVYFPQGKALLTDGATVKFLAECQNTIHRITFLKKEEPVAVLPPVQPASPAEVCESCGTVQVPPVKVQPPTTCVTPDGKVHPIVNGVCQLPPITAEQPVRTPTRQVPCCLQTAPPVTQAPPPVYVPPIVAPVQPQGCPGGNCVPPRRTEAGGNGVCRIKAGTNRVPECNFPWKVLRTQDDILNCGCQILVPNPRQIIGFPDAMPGSPRCLEQKKLWANIQGLRYSDTRGN